MHSYVPHLPHAGPPPAEHTTLAPDDIHPPRYAQHAHESHEPWTPRAMNHEIPAPPSPHDSPPSTAGTRSILPAPPPHAGMSIFMSPHHHHPPPPPPPVSHTTDPDGVMIRPSSAEWPMYDHHQHTSSLPAAGAWAMHAPSTEAIYTEQDRRAGRHADDYTAEPAMLSHAPGYYSDMSHAPYVHVSSEYRAALSHEDNNGRHNYGNSMIDLSSSSNDHNDTSNKHEYQADHSTRAHSAKPLQVDDTLDRMRSQGHRRKPGASSWSAPPPLYLPPHAPRLLVPTNLPPAVMSLLDVLAYHVSRGGPSTEEEIVQREAGNTHFDFLHARAQDEPKLIYYRWRLYALMQGDSMTRWRTEPYQIERGERAYVWQPPPLPDAGPAGLLGDAYAIVCDDSTHVAMRAESSTASLSNTPIQEATTIGGNTCDDSSVSMCTTTQGTNSRKVCACPQEAAHSGLPIVKRRSSLYWLLCETSARGEVFVTLRHDAEDEWRALLHMEETRGRQRGQTGSVDNGRDVDADWLQLGSNETHMSTDRSNEAARVGAKRWHTASSNNNNNSSNNNNNNNNHSLNMTPKSESHTGPSQVPRVSETTSVTSSSMWGALLRRDVIAYRMCFALEHAHAARHMLSILLDEMVHLARTAAAISSISNYTPSMNSESPPDTRAVHSHALTDNARATSSAAMRELERICYGQLWYVFILHDVMQNSEAEVRMSASEREQRYTAGADNVPVSRVLSAAVEMILPTALEACTLTAMAIMSYTNCLSSSAQTGRNDNDSSSSSSSSTMEKNQVRESIVGISRGVGLHDEDASAPVTVQLKLTELDNNNNNNSCDNKAQTQLACQAAALLHWVCTLFTVWSNAGEGVCASSAINHKGLGISSSSSSSSSTHRPGGGEGDVVAAMREAQLGERGRRSARWSVGRSNTLKLRAVLSARVSAKLANRYGYLLLD